MLNYMVIPGITVTTEEVITTVCRYYQANEGQVRTKRHGNRAFTRVRQIIHYLCVIYHTDDTREIGKRAGRLTHSAVTYSTKAIYKELTYSNKLHRELQELHQLIKG